MIRTRAIIKNLSYDELVKRGTIPDLNALILQSPTAITAKRYPPFVYKTKEYAVFGIIMDYIIRAGLRINLQQKVEIGVDPTSSIIETLQDNEMIRAMTDLSIYETSKNMNDIVSTSLKLAILLSGQTSYTPEMLGSYVPTTVNIVKEIIAKWQYYGLYLNGTVSFNTEYSYGCFSGHPDIVSNLCVLDIKNTNSFSKMSKESSLQVLAYYALMKPTMPDIKYVGFILPMQREIVIYNVSNWNPLPFLHLLNEEGEKLSKSMTLQNSQIEMLMQQFNEININQQTFGQILAMVIPITFQNQQSYPTGSHISKGKNIATTLNNYVTQRPGLPCQMFLTNPRTGKRDAKTAGQITAAAQVIKDHNLLYFTHAPYVINLSANVCDPVDGYWQQRILNEDLAFTVAMGGRGVVVHTGAKKNLSEEDALNIMEHMVRSALPYATESCPLLLETPCGEKSEIVAKIEELGTFFFRFSTEERKKLGLCVDTCHCHAAGYDPLAYLQHWEQYCHIPIRLIHFNDSATPQGSHVDRHAAPGTGHIGMEKMQAIAQWAYERNIPMVRE